MVTAAQQCECSPHHRTDASEKLKRFLCSSNLAPHMVLLGLNVCVRRHLEEDWVKMNNLAWSRIKASTTNHQMSADVRYIFSYCSCLDRDTHTNLSACTHVSQNKSIILLWLMVVWSLFNKFGMAKLLKDQVEITGDEHSALSDSTDGQTGAFICIWMQPCQSCYC